jgi:hypothetical protein
MSISSVTTARASRTISTVWSVASSTRSTLARAELGVDDVGERSKPAGQVGEEDAERSPQLGGRRTVGGFLGGCLHRDDRQHGPHRGKTALEPAERVVQAGMDRRTRQGERVELPALHDGFYRRRCGLGVGVDVVGPGEPGGDLVGMGRPTGDGQGHLVEQAGLRPSDAANRVPSARVRDRDRYQRLKPMPTTVPMSVLTRRTSAASWGDDTPRISMALIGASNDCSPRRSTFARTRDAAMTTAEAPPGQSDDAGQPHCHQHPRQHCSDANQAPSEGCRRSRPARRAAPSVALSSRRLPATAPRPRERRRQRRR